MKFLALTIAVLLPLFTFADDLEIKSEPADMKFVRITASKVKGISIKVYREITRHDCNARMIVSTITHVDGNKDMAWYQTVFVMAGTATHEAYCPIATPITEKIYSEPVVFKSLNNQYADGLIELSLYVPVGYELDVTEIK